MSLQTWLMPQENIYYTAPDNVEYGGSNLKFHITDQRIVLHNHKGLIFKKESVVTERLDDIVSMSYREEGILFAKKGVLQIQTKQKIMDFKGKPESIKVIWQNLQQYIKR